jgi:hypothetical protein
MFFLVTIIRYYQIGSIIYLPPGHLETIHVNSTKDHLHATLWRRLILRGKRLHIPNGFRILVDASVTRKETHPRNRCDALAGPLFRVLVALINELLGLDVRCEVIRHKVVVPMVDNTVDESREALSVAEHAPSDGVEDLGKLGLDLVSGVEMCMSEVFNVFCEVTEEEDVLLADFTGDLNLCHVSCNSLSVHGTKLTLAPSQVPMIKPPLRQNFMLEVPEASVPAVEMCSLMSLAGQMISALLTL